MVGSTCRCRERDARIARRFRKGPAPEQATLEAHPAHVEAPAAARAVCRSRTRAQVPSSRKRSGWARPRVQLLGEAAHHSEAHRDTELRSGVDVITNPIPRAAIEMKRSTRAT